jgi:hypothetical protein
MTGFTEPFQSDHSDRQRMGINTNEGLALYLIAATVLALDRISY